MFGDRTLDSLVFHDLTKFLGVLAVLGAWWCFYWMALKPHFKAAGEAASAEPPRTPPAFPFFGLLVMMGFTGLFFYYVTMEPAFRKTDRIPSRAEETNHALERQKRAASQSPEYIPPAGIDKMTEKIVEKGREENAAAKEKFRGLPAVKGNRSSGAQSNE